MSSLSVETLGIVLGCVNLVTAGVVWLLPETAGFFLDNLESSSANERSKRRSSVRASVSALSEIITPHKRVRAPSFRFSSGGDSFKQAKQPLFSDDEEDPIR